MAIEKHMLHAQSTDDVTVLKDRIAELEKDNKRLENAVDVYKSNANVFKCKVAEMSMKLCESRKNHKVTSRALWLARAEKAKERKIHFDNLDYLGISVVTINFESARTWMTCKTKEPSKWAIIFEKVEQKCRAKAEEYK